MELVKCPHCNVRMIPTSSGDCVSCSRSLTEPRTSAFTDEPEQEFEPKSNGLILTLLISGMLATLFGLFQLAQLVYGLSGLRIALIGISFVIATACFLNARAP